MANFNWNRFETRINVKAPIEKLYNCWATRQGMEEWFLRDCKYFLPDGTLRKKEEPVNKDDTYKWLWFGYDDEVVETGRIIEGNGKDFLKFSFGNGGNCTVTIKMEQGENMVALVQDNIPTDEEGMRNYHLGCKTGWTFYLANLKSIMEGGIDLRNKNENLKDMVNA